MRPREERLDNEEHSWLFQSDWEDAAGKLVLRFGKAGNCTWSGDCRVRARLEQLWGGNWRTATLAVIVAGDQVREEREMAALQARRGAGWSTKGRR